MSPAMMVEVETRTEHRPRVDDRDLELVEALQSREAWAAERLVTTYGDRAYRLAVGITGNAQDAEEVVQDACWNVIRKIDSFRADAAFGSWFYRVVANAAYAKLRTRHGRRNEVCLDEVLPVVDELGQSRSTDWSASVHDPAVQAEVRETLTAAIGELPEIYRTAVILRDVEGLSHLEIAHVLGVTVANAKARVHRARLYLRNRLGEVLSADVGAAA